jgi:hypothetical protein
VERRRGIEPRVLLVEGKDEQFVLPELLEAAGIAWPKENRPLWIADYKGVEAILKPGAIEAELKASGMKSLGIVVDADIDADARWERVRQRLTQTYPDFPQRLDPDGVIHSADGINVGVWIMPDNVQAGMLETLLLAIRTGEPTVAAYSAEACTKARTLGAPFREVHRDKAELHTWMAWQDPPGQRMQDALKKKQLNVNIDRLRGFVAWVKELHDL